MLKPSLLGALLLAPVLSAAALPAAADSAADLGKTLTPYGAIKAANKDGSIPEWTGGINKAPAGFKKGDHQVDPFADDKPLFTIDASNMDRYADKLPDGLKAMLKQYPQTYKMTVYPTRRSAAAPQRIYDGTIANATRGKLTENGNGVVGAQEGIPFPIPTEGVQAVWNHVLRWRGNTVVRRYGQANPQSDGSFTMITIQEKVKYLFTQPGGPGGNVSLYFLQEVVAPARLAGEMLLVHDTINQVAEPRNAWTYNPGQRRVRRAPNVAYDNPGTAADGLRTSDQLDMYNGSPDRYDWKLIGRQEMYVPYNAYKLDSDKVTYNQIIKPKHINQDLARYELHRVWIVEGTVKKGTSHIYAKRRFYIDEDSWQILVADQYDSRGQMWRVGESHGIAYAEVPVYTTTLDCFYDLQSGRYTCNGFNNQEPAEDYDAQLTAADFSPDALRQSGIR